MSSSLISNSIHHVLIVLLGWFVRWKVSAALQVAASRIYSKHHPAILYRSHLDFSPGISLKFKWCNYTVSLTRKNIWCRHFFFSYLLLECSQGEISVIFLSSYQNVKINLFFLSCVHIPYHVTMFCIDLWLLFYFYFLSDDWVQNMKLWVMEHKQGHNFEILGFKPILQ